MDIGGTIKKIRRGKNITQKALAENILSRPHLSLIENNKSDISMSLLIQILEKLHLPVDEFVFLANDCSISESKSMALQLMNEANKANTKGLNNLLKDSKSKFKEYDSYEFYHISLLTEIYIRLLDNNFTINEEIQNIANPIKVYLFNLSDWYIYDLKLFSNSLFIFDVFTVESIADKLFNSLKKYELYPNSREDYLNILINMSTYFIEKEKYKLSLKFAYKGKQKTKNVDKIYENILLDINISIANIKLHIEPEKNITLIQNRLFLLDSLKFTKLKNHYENLLDKYGVVI